MTAENNKSPFKIIDKDKTYLIEKAYDIYEMYNDFAMDLDEHSDEWDINVVTSIRDCYQHLYDNIKIDSTISLERFELLACVVLSLN